MRLIRPSAEIWTQEAGISGIYKQIERCARVCYKSEDKIGEGTAKKMVEMLTKRGHTAMLEHGTVYLAMPMETIIPIEANGWGKYTKNPYSKGFKICEVNGQKRVAVTTNLRVLVENGWLDDLKYICEPTEYHERRITVRFVCDRGVSHEFVRHRVFSFAQESTRYCNYSKDKFGNEITFIEPCWLDSYNYNGNTYGNCFLTALEAAEASYFDLLKKWDDKIPDKRYKTGFRNNPWTPQQARAILPNSLKTELVMTGFISDWKHFFELRTAQNAHPQMRELAIPLKEMMI
jgi:thymidylate synthase (FAD)|nr:MAG TPA: Thymidylate synthase complementing protein [Crassvirales sp.]